MRRSKQIISLCGDVAAVFRYGPRCFFQCYMGVTSGSRLGSERCCRNLGDCISSIICPSFPCSRMCTVGRIIRGVPSSSILRLDVGSDVHVAGFFGLGPEVGACTGVKARNVSNYLSSFLKRTTTNSGRDCLIVNSLTFFCSVGTVELHRVGGGIRVLLVGGRNNSRFCFGRV